jgi:hypothetical protein
MAALGSAALSGDDTVLPAHELALLERARALIPRLAERAPGATADRNLPPETIAEYHKAGILRILQPRRFGGLQGRFSLFSRIVEELTFGCASSAWVYAVLAEHQWIIAQYPEQAQIDVWGDDPLAVASSSLAPRAPAKRVSGGWHLSGRYTFSSGCDYAQWAILGAFLGEAGDPRWLRDTGTAVAEVAALNADARAALIVDGRDHPLAALAFSDNVKRLGAAAPFVLFIGENSRVDRLAELDEDALDCLLPMPLNERLLANAFRGLPLLGHESRAPRETIADPDERVTPIAAHPKFTGDTAPAVDMRAIERLRALGGEDFLRELIDTFRVDAGLARERLERAVAEADTAAFGRGLAALRRCAGHLGGTHFCHQLASGLGETELRQHGELHLQRIASEIDRLVTTLMNLPALEQDHSVA